MATFREDPLKKKLRQALLFIITNYHFIFYFCMCAYTIVILSHLCPECSVQQRNVSLLKLQTEACSTDMNTLSIACLLHSALPVEIKTTPSLSFTAIGHHYSIALQTDLPHSPCLKWTSTQSQDPSQTVCS